MTLVLDSDAANCWVLDADASTCLVLTVQSFVATGTFTGCLQSTVAMRGACELGPTMQAAIDCAPAMQAAVEFTGTIQASFLVAPTMAGALEIGVMTCEGELLAELLLENTIDVRIVGLKVGSAFVNDATCIVTLREINEDDSDGSIVVGADSIALDHVDDVDGEYLGRLPADLDLVKSETYRLKARAEKSGVAVGTWSADLVAKVRSASHCS